MTRRVQNQVKCPKCGEEVNTFTPFSLWLRELKAPLDSSNYDNENLDYIFFQYRKGWLITMEEKRYGAQSTPAQSDTHNLIAQMLRNSSGSKFKTMRGERPIEYRGHYVISFSQTTPDDSESITINNRKCTKDDVLFLLSNGSLPPAPVPVVPKPLGAVT